MHATWSIAAAGASVPRPTVAPRVAPRVMKAADLLSFERQGYWLDRGLLDKAQVQALAPALDRVYDQQAHAVLRQKVRVVLGDDALSQAEASGSSLRAQTKEFRRRLEAAPDGAIPFLQLFNAWRHSPDVLQLLSSPRLASTAAQLLGLDPGRPGAGPGQRVRLLQDSLFVKRVGDGETHWHADLAMAPLDTNAMVTCWIPLQPVPAEASGGSGLVFAGGSHRDVALPFWHGDPREAGDVSQRGYVEGSCGAMRLGDASWHHGWTLHCAPPNGLPTPRRALAASFFLDGTITLRHSSRKPDDEDLESHAEWMRAVSPGKPARHALLPVVWPQGGAIGGPGDLRGDLRGAPPRAVGKPPSPSQGDKSGKAKAKRAGARKPRAPAAARNQKS